MQAVKRYALTPLRLYDEERAETVWFCNKALKPYRTRLGHARGIRHLKLAMVSASEGR